MVDLFHFLNFYNSEDYSVQSIKPYNVCLYLGYEQILQQPYMYLYFNQDSLFKSYITVPKQDKKKLAAVRFYTNLTTKTYN